MNVPKERIGPKHIEKDLAPVLFEAWKNGFAVSSNFARQQAPYVAMAASMQLITTRIADGLYSSQWLVTAKGIRLLNELELVGDDNDGEDNSVS